MAALAGAAYFSLPQQTPPAKTGNSAPDGMFQASDAVWDGLRFITVKEKTFHDEVRAEGKIVSNDDTTTPVFAPYTGRVTRLFALEGQQVKRGDPLMALAAPDYTSERAQLKLATENEKRQHALYDAKTAPLKDWLQAQADLETAKGNFRAAGIEQQALRERLRALGKSDAEIDALEADAIVTAPIDGIVIARQVGLGEYLNSAAGGASIPAFSIGDPSTVWLLAGVREEDASLMQVGEAVEVRVLAYPGRVFHAKLTYVASAIDPTTHRLPVRAEIANEDGALKPEMFADFSIFAGGDKDSAAVPQDAVIYEGRDAHVWVAQADKKLLGIRPIRVGRSEGDAIEALSGLAPGDMVVTSGSLFIDRAAKGDGAGAPEMTTAASPQNPGKVP